jgi:hypothetical protein
VDKLQQQQWAPATPPSTDPLELIIWENIAYLASDKRRAEAFSIFKRTLGTRPEPILAARPSALAAMGKAGILPDVQNVRVAYRTNRVKGGTHRIITMKPIRRFPNPHGAFDSPTRHLAYWRNFANLE